jgi:hypothetical protein
MARIRVLVTTDADVDLDSAVQSWRELGFAETSVMRGLHVVAGAIDSDAVTRLAAHPGVKAVEPEREVRTLG